MIELKNVSMSFTMASDRVSGLKEFLIQLMKKKISKKKFKALNNISFTVQEGDVVGIIGANGAGKSTLLKIISGILAPTEGEVTVSGKIAPMLELGAGFDHDLTARENVFLNGAVLGYSKAFLEEKYDEIVEFSELGEFMNTPIRNFSSGMIMRLAFSIATLVNPDILIVDEILSVGDAHFHHKSEERMLSLIKGGTTVLLVTHALEQVRELCDKAIWLNKGTIEMIGSSEDICDEYEKVCN